MGKELDYQGLVRKYSKLSTQEINDLIADMRTEINQVADRPSCPGFIVLDDATNNLKFAVLQELLEKKIYC